METTTSLSHAPAKGLIVGLGIIYVLFAVLLFRTRRQQALARARLLQEIKGSDIFTEVLAHLRR